MELNDLFEKVTMEMVLEGCGVVASLALTYTLFFNGGMGYLAEIIGMTLCG